MTDDEILAQARARLAEADAERAKRQRGPAPWDGQEPIGAWLRQFPVDPPSPAPSPPPPSQPAFQPDVAEQRRLELEICSARTAVAAAKAAAASALQRLKAFESYRTDFERCMAGCLSELRQGDKALGERIDGVRERLADRDGVLEQRFEAQQEEIKALRGELVELRSRLDAVAKPRSAVG